MWFVIFLQMTEESTKSAKIEPCSHITTKIAIQTNDNLCQNVWIEKFLFLRYYMALVVAMWRVLQCTSSYEH